MQYDNAIMQYDLTDIEGSLYTHAGLPYSEGALPDPSAYSATSLASASLLYSSWFAQTKPGQLFGLQGKLRPFEQSNLIFAKAYQIYLHNLLSQSL